MLQFLSKLKMHTKLVPEAVCKTKLIFLVYEQDSQNNMVNLMAKKKCHLILDQYFFKNIILKEKC